MAVPSVFYMIWFDFDFGWKISLTSLFTIIISQFFLVVFKTVATDTVTAQIKVICGNQ
jgi:hypothetical protein